MPAITNEYGIKKFLCTVLRLTQNREFVRQIEKQIENCKIPEYFEITCL